MPDSPDPRQALRERVRDLYTELEQLEIRHVDLSDPDPSDALRRTLDLHFVWGEPVGRLPVTFHLFSLRGDRALRRLVRHFLDDTRPLLEQAAVPPGQARLDLLQDDALTTPGGRRYHVWLGSSPEPRPAQPLPDELFRRPVGRELGWAALVTALALAFGGWLLSRLP